MRVVFFHVNFLAKLHIFDFVDQVILSHIDMHPFMAYGVIQFGYA